MSLRIGHASIDENGKIQGGKLGDNNKKEVCTRSYYLHSKGWYVLRPKSPEVANAIAQAMLEACNNNNIGYDQSNRYSVITNLKKYGTMAKIATPCESDCSSLVRGCILQATGKDVGDFTTSSEPSVLEKSGLFNPRMSVGLTTKLYNGDVLVTKTKGHTVIVVSGNPRDSKIDTVLEVQSWLNDKYDFNLDVDNKYGKLTKKALVKALQLELNKAYNTILLIDGDFGPKTKLAIRTLRKGATGDYVKVLQALLVCNGYKNAYVDGSYGPGTYDAVKTYQKKKGLTVNGVAGPETFAKLCV
jgi:hypothetical protein